MIDDDLGLGLPQEDLKKLDEVMVGILKRAQPAIIAQVLSEHMGIDPEETLASFELQVWIDPDKNKE